MTLTRTALAAAAALAALLAAAVPGVAGDDLGHGWHDGVDWVAYDGAVAAAGGSKPIMYVISASWCGACKRLKPLFSASKEIEEASSNFVMVSLQDDETPGDAQFKPDGGYIPRILFADATGAVDTSLKNPGGNPKYGYFYSDASSIVSAMKQASSKLAGGGAGSRDDL